MTSNQWKQKMFSPLLHRSYSRPSLLWGWVLIHVLCKYSSNAITHGHTFDTWHVTAASFLLLWENVQYLQSFTSWFLHFIVGINLLPLTVSEVVYKQYCFNEFLGQIEPFQGRTYRAPLDRGQASPRCNILHLFPLSPSKSVIKRWM